MNTTKHAPNCAYLADGFLAHCDCAAGVPVAAEKEGAPVRTLTLVRDNFDKDNTIAVEVRGFRGPKTIWASLCRDYEKVGDGVYWIMQHAGVTASSYTEAEVRERNRLNSMVPFRAGETVRITGESGEFVVVILGDYSNAAIVEPVESLSAKGSAQRAAFIASRASA